MSNAGSAVTLVQNRVAANAVAKSDRLPRTILVHGTFSDETTFTDEFKSAIAETLNDPNQENFKWSGDNTDEARQKAAQELLAQINNGYEYADGEEINIVDHSHRGNVAKITSNDYDYENNPKLNLYNFGTPNRDDYTASENLNSFYNIYNQRDVFVQNIIGGTDSSSNRTVNIPIPIIDKIVDTNINIYIPYNPSQIASEPNAINVPVNQDNVLGNNANTTTKIIGAPFSAILGAKYNHTDMKNPDTVEELKKYLRNYEEAI
jgi:hypothetical protein